MKYSFLLLVILLAVPFVFSTSSATEFSAWKSAHKKSYDSDEEEAKRFSIWTRNAEFIAKHNANKEKTYSVAMNKFGDLTNEEFVSLYMSGKRQIARSSNHASYPFLKSGEYPASFDWRTKIPLHVVDQGQCGGDYGQLESIEATVFLGTGQLVDYLSQIHVCESQGCQGGPIGEDFYLVQKCGVWNTSSVAHCDYDPEKAYEILSGTYIVHNGNETDLQQAVYELGPVSVVIDASLSSFQFYSGGVYYEPSCSSSLLDHNVLVDGWGIEGDSQYWLVQNSWGEDWGLQGFILMSRNRGNNCGIASAAEVGIYGKQNPMFKPTTNCYFYNNLSNN
eukprot:TRINITY_DN3707_c0_g1_i1.p1 TRINITY_DN3707_c0_g1~~TRINITY_DN3707_c0_g1_i1.p1  ORF type:complete len:335 (-),score=60.45 TRINITY_DN3707_c0_g1_i1:7-1011(-)